MEFQVGDVVCSKAGRDEGTFLVVVGIEAGTFTVRRKAEAA